MPLTTKKIAKAVRPGRYGDGHGLYLQVTPAGVKSWLFRYQRGDRERWMGIGPVHTFSLADARERALRARQQLIDGIDPVDERRAKKAALALEAAKTMSFQECAIAYFDSHERKWRNAKHRQQFLSTLKHYAFPKFGKLTVSAIDTGLVLSVIEPIWKEKTETANRVRNRIESVLDWATVRGYRSGDNPARWKGHLAEVLPGKQQIAKPKHHAALPYADLPSFMEELRKRDGIASRALEFTILTAARTSEVTGAQWSEIDMEAKVWTVPAGRIKGGRDHRVPLSSRAVAILKMLPREVEYVFPGARKGQAISNMAMDAVLRRQGYKGGRATVHGFRSTFRDWAAERTAYPNHVVEMALAHSIGNKVEAAYRRGDLFDKRQRLMAEWARYCSLKLPDYAANNVTPMRKVRAR